MSELPQKQEPEPTLSVKYYAPPPPKKQMQQQPQLTVPIVYNPEQIFNPSMIPPYATHYQPSPVLVKNYVIQTTGGIDGAQEYLARVREDVLPDRKFSPSYTTLAQRISDYRFIRSAILYNSDGNDVDVHGSGENSLTRFIKIDAGDVNPYNSYKISGINKYKGLPYGFLLFRSCYPIRHLSDMGTVTCAKDSTAINIRVYKMLEGSYSMNRIQKRLFYNYDEWREVAFYEYIREKILQPKICPNFVTMYGYYIAHDSRIDYDKINATNESIVKPMERQHINTSDLHPVKLIGKDLAKYQQEKKEQLEREYRNSFVPSFDPIQPEFKSNNKELIEQQKLDEQKKSIITIDCNKQIQKENPNAYLGKSLVMLTESPTHSLFAWASASFRNKNENQIIGNVEIMTGSGFHEDDKWLNMLFQLMVALHVMQINNIYIDNFQMDQNVFVKDLSLKGAIREFWKYKIGGIDYYLPNLGHILMIDSNFRDLDISNDIKNQKRHKIFGNFIDPTIDPKIMRERTFEMFKACFNNNIFGPNSEFRRNQGNPPPPEITSLIDRIMNDIATDEDKLIEPYILRHMKYYVHNRTGTYLKSDEVPNIRKIDKTEFTRGQLVVLEENGDSKFVMFVKSVNDGQAEIITRENAENKDYVLRNVPINALSNYSKMDPIQQNFKPNEEVLTNEGLLETYVIPIISKNQK
jgi:hypothetical protein